MTTDKINPSKRVRSWHRSHIMQAGCSSVSLRAFARNLVKLASTPMTGMPPNFRAITADWMASKGMQQ